ncbi:hypothetical protein CFOL_v3_23324 [Cephalotus follicularis]|uniref:Uncharacterized protein n=1 Tax=Cephalotus follicularis TaxID=3775 RepID=A0A1Q3CII0_CEPFO|nr:hypothetical protein CFOL_v3_23324 [Cephalotus follicularis]
MVLWEITLGTAYFLGLKRTYRLALKLQRRIISPKHPKIRQSLHRRTRTIFDVALRFHRNIQERDLEVGRNLGNWILRWLDRMKPSAQIRANSPGKPFDGASPNMNMKKQVTRSSQLKTPSNIQTSKNGEIDRHLFTSSRWPKSFPTVPMMMRPPRPAGMNTQYRHLCIQRPDMLRSNYMSGRFEGVIRKDIMQWMQQN